MISAWGVDHGSDTVSKRWVGRLALGGVAGVASGLAADKVMDKTDPDYKKKAKANPRKLARIGGAGAAVGGTLVAGPAVGIGAGVGAHQSLYWSNASRKKKR